MALVVVFVHGWSVTNVNTYGELPLRLRAEAASQGVDLEVQEIYLGKYISFHDVVRLPDISRAFRTAVADQLAGVVKAGRKFICITHSTGGPVIRDWWYRYYFQQEPAACPMSHLIMMAPANHGSALAQLGKARVGRLSSWLQGVEPGQGVLDWLEFGSSEAWELNKEWILNGEKQMQSTGVFPFVLTGQSIDRKLYDNLNNYTGELGSDGVVRVAAANLESRLVRLKQPPPKKDRTGKLVSGKLEIDGFWTSVRSPLRILTHKSHSGTDMGIITSVKKESNDKESKETINAIIACLRVQTNKDYDNLCKQFDKETATVLKNEKVETEKQLLFAVRKFIHDQFSQVIFRVIDTEGYPVRDYDLLITAGKDSDPNHLPDGFSKDRQRNSKNAETITYYFNYDLLRGSGPVTDQNNKVIRKRLDGIKLLGLEVKPRPDQGFVRYLPCGIDAREDLFKAIVPNSTTLVEIRLQRLVHKEVFRMDSLKGNKMPTKEEGDFKNIAPGGEVIE